MSAFRFAARRAVSASSSASALSAAAAVRPIARAGQVQPARWLSASLPRSQDSKPAAAEDSKAEVEAEGAAAEGEPSRGKVMYQLQKELKQKEEEVNKLKEGLALTLANFENLQKTTSRDVASAKEFGISKFATDLISVVDVLSMAIQSAPPSEGPNSLLEGVQMTAENLEKTLARHGVTKFDPTGEKFDPNKHEALFMVPAAAAGEGKQPGTVMNCQKTGWMFKTRTLRAAQVGVVQ